MFYEISFPQNLSLNFKKSIKFNNKINISNNGFEQIQSLWEKSKSVFEINKENLNKEELEKIVSFFNIVKGNSIGFRFKDWFDYDAKKQILGTYNGKKVFQLIKNYFSVSNNGDSFLYTKIIRKPISNTVSVYINNVQINNFLVNYNEGLIDVLYPLNDGDVVSADFQFEIPVRFMNDELKIVVENKNLSKIENLELIEVY